MKEKKKILIVEDERIIAEDIKRTLVNFGYQVPAIYSSGEDALKNVSEIKPDLILMDIMLEGQMNGIETAGIIRDTTTIPVIYLTAYANENTLQSAKITEPFGYIIKPFEERELHATIEMAFYRYKVETALHRKTKQQEQLLISAQHLTSSLNIEEVLAKIGKEAKEILDSYSCIIYLVSPDNIIKPVIAIDPHYEKEILATCLSMDDSFTGKVIQDKKGMIFAHSETNNIGKQIPGTPAEQNEHIIISPFLIGDKAIGAMCLSKFDRIYTEEDLALANAFAAYASSALNNAQTHENLITEIDERKKAEEQLRKTQFRLTSVFTNVPNIILYEKYGGRHFVSDNIFTLIGYKADDFQSKEVRISNLIHPDDIDIVRDKFKSWFESEGSDFLNLWYRLKKKDGNYIWIEDRMVSIKKDNEKKYITGVMIDNTNLKKAEVALQKSQIRYKAVVEDQSEVIIRYIKDGTLTFINEAFCRYFEKDSCSLIGQNFYELFPLEEQKQLKESINNLSKKSPTNTFESSLLHVDGSESWMDWLNRIIFDNNGNISEYQSVGRNITGRKLAELEKEQIQQQLIQSQKMETVGRLAGGIAHDFNNLLTAINGYADLAMSKLDPGSEIKKDISVVRDCGSKAANLTRQLLAFSRKQIVEPLILNLNDIVTDMDKMLRRLIGEDIEFETVTCDNLFPVKVDKTQIEQVLTNLVVNARDAIDSGGKIVVSLSNKFIDDPVRSIHNEMEEGEYILLSVKDNGSGISDDVKEHLFEPFYTTKDQGKGTGLGLATVFGIINQYKGYIFIESKIGEGTEFKIYLHISEEPYEVTSSDLENDELLGGNETVLLTEDEPSIREFVSDILEEYGYNVITAENGVESLELSKKYNDKIDLLFTDVIMPNMNGQELSEKIKEFHPNIKVLFMSGYTESTAIQKGVLESKSGFLQKPFTANGLIKKVRDILDS